MPDTQPDTPISVHQPALTRRLHALMLGHQLGLYAYIGPLITPEAETVYPVSRDGKVYMLQAGEVEAFTYGLALGVGGPELADQVAYRPEMVPDLSQESA